MNPFAITEADSISALGENRLIGVLKDALGEANPPAPYGIGDDCAVFPAPPPGHQQLITTDPVIYGKHFNDSLSPSQTAEKLLKRNLSDIASMGGTPHVAVISLALPPNVSTDWILAFYSALSRAAKSYATSIVGGDVSSSQTDLSAHLTLIGSAPQEAILIRRQAMPGSTLYTTGPLGGSILRKHYAFEPRLEEGRWLAAQTETLSCMDISDGLGKDCLSLLADGCQAHLDAKLIPISEDALKLSKKSKKPPLFHAINDGEDFELLFAVSKDAKLEDFESRWNQSFEAPLHRIGTVEGISKPEAARIQLSNTKETIIPSGYEHLR